MVANAELPPDDDDDRDFLDDGEDDLLEGISPKQQRAILELLNQPTVPKAAAAAKVGQRTLHRWLTEPVFSRAYRTARREAFSHAVGLTQRFAPLAVNTLAQIMADKTAPHHARVTAATSLLRFGREGIELDDLAARLEALEQAEATRGERSWG